MPDFRITAYTDAHFDGVKSLWDACFPGNPEWNRAEVAIPAKLAAQGDLFFVALAHEAVVGTTMAGYDGHRGWLHYVAVHPDHQRTGLAKAMVAHAEAALQALGCVKVNLQVRAGNEQAVSLYRQLGYSEEEMVSMGKRLGEINLPVD